MVSYVPKRGDVIWLDFDHQKGHEIKKTRPAFVISPERYNKKTHLALVMPITGQIKGYPFEIEVSIKTIQGTILSDQIRSVDWVARKAKKIGIAPALVVRKAIENVLLLLSIDDE